MTGRLTLKPDYAAALNRRALVLRDLGRLDDALAAVDQALAIRPHDLEALNTRGIDPDRSGALR